MGSDAELDDTMDREALHALLLTHGLRRLTADGLAQVVRGHWADFELLDEVARVSHKSEYSAFVGAAISGSSVEHRPEVKQDLIDVLAANAMRFERRANVFRVVHPLALQLILSSGVLNGILSADP